MEHRILNIEDPFEDLREGALELFLPENLREMGRQDRRRPNLLILPGGGYGFCSRREAEPIALTFAAEGYNVFVLYYVTAPTGRWPDALLQVAAALELMERHQKEWHCDMEKVAVMGFSAGGHLAAQYCNCYDCPEVRAMFPRSRGFRAAILCYPVISTAPAAAHPASFRNLLGHWPLTPEEEAKHSCDRLVTERTPHTFLWHTAADTTAPVENSLRYAGALASCGVPFELHVFPYGPHGAATADRRTCDTIYPGAEGNTRWLDLARSWLDQEFSL